MLHLYRLELLQEQRQLKPFWLKKDNVLRSDCIFIFYKIEPMGPGESGFPTEQIIAQFDVMHIWEIFKDSDLWYSHSPQIPLKSFAEFLKRKEIEIPDHLAFLLEGGNRKSDDKFTNDSEKKAVDGFIASARPVQYQRVFLRIVAQHIWRNYNQESKPSASALIENNQDFKKMRKFIGAEDTGDKVVTSWISDLSPRAKKNKKAKATPAIKETPSC